MRLSIEKLTQVPGRLLAGLETRYSAWNGLLTYDLYTDESCDELLGDIKKLKDQPITEHDLFVPIDTFHLRFDGGKVYLEFAYADDESKRQVGEMPLDDFEKLLRAWRQALIDGKSGYTIEI